MTLLLATANAHKIQEVQETMPGIEIVTPGELSLEFDPEETADTFVGNALIKAQALYALMAAHPGIPRVPILADDSGLCVDALSGAPGIYSSRYGSRPGGPKLDAATRNDYLLRAVTGARDRSAHYVCAMVLYYETDRFVVVQETWKGRLAQSPSSGSGGFGYDPIFEIDAEGTTAADISSEEKHRISHRGKALQRIRALVQARE